MMRKEETNELNSDATAAARSLPTPPSELRGMLAETTRSVLFPPEWTRKRAIEISTSSAVIALNLQMR